MKYFHRTALAADDVMTLADEYFGARLTEAARADRSRGYQGAVGRVSVAIRPDGGHYTHIRVETDQVGESEADKLVKRFLGLVHQRVDPSHDVRGAY